MHSYTWACGCFFFFAACCTHASSLTVAGGWWLWQIPYAGGLLHLLARGQRGGQSLKHERQKYSWNLNLKNTTFRRDTANVNVVCRCNGDARLTLANTLKEFYREIKWNLIDGAHTSVCPNFVVPLIAACKSSAIKKTGLFMGRMFLMDGLLLFQSWSWGPHLPWDPTLMGGTTSSQRWQRCYPLFSLRGGCRHELAYQPGRLTRFLWD